jgi:hypothetical protein
MESEATMSRLVVEGCEIKAVSPYPQSDAQEFINVKGWRVIVQKALGLTVGQRIVYFPPDTVMTPERGVTAAGDLAVKEHGHRPRLARCHTMRRDGPTGRTGEWEWRPGWFVRDPACAPDSTHRS